MDRAIERFQEAPKHRSGTVAQYRALTAGENCGHEAAVQAQTGVADSIDALVDAVEPAIVSCVGDRVLSHARPTKLARSDDAMLLRAAASDERPRGVDFFPHGWE